MKSAIAILFLVLGFTESRAGFYADECSMDPVRDEIIDMVSHETPFSGFELDGTVTMRFTIDAEGMLHIVNIASGNVFLSDHVIATLQNKKMDCACAQPGTVYTITLHYSSFS